MDLHSPVKTVSKIFQVMNGIFKFLLLKFTIATPKCIPQIY